MTALALALGSSLCWGVSDFVCGLESRRVPLLAVMLISQLVGLVGVLIWLALRGTGPPAVRYLLPAFIAGLAGLAALAAFYRALAIGTMSIVAPIASLGVAVPVTVGIAGGDRPGALQVAGLLAAVFGVVLASREQSTGATSRRTEQLSIGLALIAALGFGSFFTALRFSARHDVVWSLLAARASGAICLVALAVILRPALPASSGSFALIALGGLLDLTANATYAAATRHGLLSVVAVAASLYPLVTIALARLVLAERVRPIQEVGIGAALLGVALMAAG